MRGVLTPSSVYMPLRNALREFHNIERNDNKQSHKILTERREMKGGERGGGKAEEKKKKNGEKKNKEKE